MATLGERAFKLRKSAIDLTNERSHLINLGVGSVVDVLNNILDLLHGRSEVTKLVLGSKHPSTKSRRCRLIIASGFSWSSPPIALAVTIGIVFIVMPAPTW